MFNNISDKVYITDGDLKIMINSAKEIHGNNQEEITKSVIREIHYAELVSNL